MTNIEIREQHTMILYISVTVFLKQAIYTGKTVTENGYPYFK